ncbi:MAG TPA: putative DNA-binding domain-containing protein [Gammaproteobacteria bacterium]|nr:putative DNA-binding domain-containing protein [Gammaproteobacteria bacterium]
MRVSVPPVAGLAELQALQRDFAAYLRDPARPLPAGLDPAAAAIYAQLFRRNLSSLLGAAYPMLRRLLPPAQWQLLVARFYAQQRYTTPLFPGIAGEFARWLAEAAPADSPTMPDWVAELADWEWLEGDLARSPARLGPSPTGPLPRGPLALSPLVRRRRYRWPVHRLAPEAIPARPPAQPSELLMWRDRGQAVRFLALSPLAAQLLARLEQRPHAAAALGLVLPAQQPAGLRALLERHLPPLLEWLWRQDVLITLEEAEACR